MNERMNVCVCAVLLRYVKDREGMPAGYYLNSKQAYYIIVCEIFNSYF